eukprot:CAMPEP_0181429782 /NCGR_PEP_ID=MMETSP1110-20121109/17379_1 /TAXON_ID=174948 /ORGANISM="Symbiodinium sp., Strain CCMP421" /LENGTH=788 /DNA_ID=CAMNT_0023553065 /DNA_START=61 /DNA_END=2427 /DNA_ORIENTATION=+
MALKQDLNKWKLSKVRDMATRAHDHKDLIKKFIRTYECEMCNDGKYGKLKYMALLQKAVNNQVDMITIELDDVEMFCKKEALAPDSDMGDSRAQLLQSIEQLVGAIELHVPRYQGFFYEICDTEQPARDENYTDEASATRVRNAVQDWRERLNAKDAAGGLDKAMGVPAKLKNPWGVRFKPRSSASSMSMRQIRGDSVGQLVQLDCLVVSVQQVKPKVQIVTYHCETCGCEVFQSVEADTYTPPKECPSTKCKENKQSGNLHRMVRSCAFTRHEEVKVQELAEHVPAGGIPRTMTVQAEGDLTRMVKPGQSITLTGVFFPQDLPYAMRMRQQSTQKMFIEAHHFQKHKSGYSETVADEGALENKIAEAKKRGSLYEAASKSIAPEIFGHQDLKKALLLVLIGAPTKQMKDGLKIRGDIHTLMMGDPGVAKSQLLKQVTYIAPRSVYTSGKGSSSAGLTASVNRDNSTGDVTLEGGALVMADCGVCCIDEFDKMDEKDRTAIHEVMEQQTISIAKAGVTTTLNCRTTVLAAANPVYGRYNPYKSPVENIDLPAALLSRFDLVFLLLDTVDGDRDKQLSRHVADVRSKYQKQEADDNPNADADDVLNLGFKPFDHKTMRAYIKKAKSFDPFLDKTLLTEMCDAYVSIRDDEKRDGLEAKKSYTTPRTLLAIARLSQAHARARFSERVERQDFEEAMRLMKASKESIELSMPAKRGENPMNIVYDIVVDLSRRDAARKMDGWVELAHVVSMAGHKALPEDLVLEAVNTWCSLSAMNMNPEKTMIQFAVPEA